MFGKKSETTPPAFFDPSLAASDAKATAAKSATSGEFTEPSVLGSATTTAASPVTAASTPSTSTSPDLPAIPGAPPAPPMFGAAGPAIKNNKKSPTGGAQGLSASILGALGQTQTSRSMLSGT